MTARYLRLIKAGFPHEAAAALALAGYDVIAHVPVGWWPT